MRANVLRTLLLCNAALALAGGERERAACASGPTCGRAARRRAARSDRSRAAAHRGAPRRRALQADARGGAGRATAADDRSRTARPSATRRGSRSSRPGIEYEPRPGGDKVSFSLEDADLPELVRVIGELTGKRFIFGGKVHNIKATVFSPQKVTVAEAYQAFLSILEANGLTVVPHGRFYKIVDSPDAKMGAPVYVAGQGGPGEDRYITRIHRLRNVSAEEVANVLGHFKSKDGDIVVYGPGNLLIITDTGTNIQRMMRILEDVDVGGRRRPDSGSSRSTTGWRRTSRSASTRCSTSRPGAQRRRRQGGREGRGAAASSLGSDVHVAKILADDRSNSLVIIATERAYLRILEFIKRLDVPSNVGRGRDPRRDAPARGRRGARARR